MLLLFTVQYTLQFKTFTTQYRKLDKLDELQTEQSQQKLYSGISHGEAIAHKIKRKNIQP